jgi:uncharacterized protein (DUF433 family)
MNIVNSNSTAGHVAGLAFSVTIALPASKTDHPAEDAPMKPTEIGKHLIVDPRVCHGKLTFKGTRVPVETILYFLSAGRSIQQLSVGWPEVTAEALQEAVELAAAALVKQSGAKTQVIEESVFS